MKNLPVVSSDEVIKALKRGGFTYAPKRGRGSHTALIKIDEKKRAYATRYCTKKERIAEGYAILNSSSSELIKRRVHRAFIKNALTVV